jgi:hypothetical protein
LCAADDTADKPGKGDPEKKDDKKKEEKPVMVGVMEVVS